MELMDDSGHVDEAIAHKLIWGYAESLEMLGRESEALTAYRRLLRRGEERIAFGDCGEGLQWARSLIADCYYRIAQI